MTETNGTRATVEYYIVRIYRRRAGKVGERAALAGVVEDTEGKQRAFSTYEELWDALSRKLEIKKPS